MIAPVPHVNKSLAGFNKNPFHQGFLTGIVTINFREFFVAERMTSIHIKSWVSFC